MKKLVQINIVSNMLSTGYIVENIAIIAKNRGWKTYVAYGRDSLPGVNEEIRIGNKFFSIEHYIENRLLDNEGLASRYATIKLIRKIKKISPDIVHLHNIHDHYLNYRLLFNYLNSSDIKVIWTFHDFWGITGHCHHFIDANCFKWKTRCNHCPLQHSTVNSLIDRSSRNYSLKKNLFGGCKNLTIVPVSYWVGEAVKESFLKDKQMIVIPNGINTDEYKPSNNDVSNWVPADKFVILSLARVWKHGDRKGLDEYIKLSELLKEDEVIVLVGMNEELSSQMPKNIIGLPRTNKKEVLVSFYSRADVLLSLSAAETFGLTILEANACGTPAIVYNNTAPPSLITDKTGFVAKNKDIQDVYKKIQIIKSKGKETYSKDCIDYVKNNFDKNQCYQRYVDLYEELIRESE